MNKKISIKKFAFIALWLCIGAGMLTLLLAAINNKNKGVCKGYQIELKGAQHNSFIDKKDVERIIMKEAGAIKGEQVASFKLNELEQALKNNTWISDAELYFDNRDILHINIIEKEPVARVFTVGGNSFYLDSIGNRMPLSNKLSARVPVFTGFPEVKKMNHADSILSKNITGMANYILKDSFWRAQVAQVDIAEDRNFEMIPLVGSHIVKLGDGEKAPQKFRRLLIFYKQVLSKTGFDKYKTIDVQFAGQVVVSKSGEVNKVDNEKLKSNIQKLIKQPISVDTAVRIVKPIVKLEVDEDKMPDDETLKDSNEPNLEQRNPNTMKLSVPKPNESKKEEVRKPKAVMPKQNTNSEERGYN